MKRKIEDLLIWTAGWSDRHNVMLYARFASLLLFTFGALALTNRLNLWIFGWSAGVNAAAVMYEYIFPRRGGGTRQVYIEMWYDGQFLGSRTAEVGPGGGRVEIRLERPDGEKPAAMVN